jgi:hypothetical protein
MYESAKRTLGYEDRCQRVHQSAKELAQIVRHKSGSLWTHQAAREAPTTTRSPPPMHGTFEMTTSSFNVTRCPQATYKRPARHTHRDNIILISDTQFRLERARTRRKARWHCSLNPRESPRPEKTVCADHTYADLTWR